MKKFMLAVVGLLTATFFYGRGLTNLQLRYDLQIKETATNVFDSNHNLFKEIKTDNQVLNQLGIKSYDLVYLNSNSYDVVFNYNLVKSVVHFVSNPSSRNTTQSYTDKEDSISTSFFNSGPEKGIGIFDKRLGLKFFFQKDGDHDEFVDKYTGKVFKQEELLLVGKISKNKYTILFEITNDVINKNLLQEGIDDTKSKK